MENSNKLSLNIHFVDGPFVEILGDGDIQNLVEFIDEDTKEIVHNGIIEPNHWIRPNRKWFTNWKIRITNTEKYFYEKKFCCAGKRVLIWFDSKSLGDNLGWMPYVEEFRRKHSCEVICSTFWNNLFKNEYKDIEFIEPGATVKDLYASYKIGAFDKDLNQNKNEWRSNPLQKVAADILGIDYREIKPKISIPNAPRNIKEKYVCMSIHSTMQGKYWNYPKGWQIVTNYLNSRGYKVILISKEKKWYRNNRSPKRIIDKMGDYPIEDRIIDLKYADMFLGVSSGLSWLSWTVGTPVVMVSGMTNPLTEFKSGIYRIFNNNICNSCLNDVDLDFDRDNWNWCPRGKNFECSKGISPNMVIEQIENIIGK